MPTFSVGQNALFLGARELKMGKKRNQETHFGIDGCHLTPWTFQWRIPIFSELGFDSPHKVIHLTACRREREEREKKERENTL